MPSFNVLILLPIFVVVSRLHGSCCETSVAVSRALTAVYQLGSHSLRLGKVNVLGAAIALGCF